jgi:hypothetical protein
MTALAQQLGHLPDSLWDFMLEFPCGFVAISTEASRYVPGTSAIERRQLQNVAFVSVQDLATENERPLHVIGHLVDHHMGCGGEPEGLWLSEGGGVTPLWREAGGRLHSLFALGYGVDEVSLSGPADYFAQSLTWYCRDRHRLNVADPLIHKWFRSTLWNEAFWRQPERRERE